MLWAHGFGLHATVIVALTLAFTCGCAYGDHWLSLKGDTVNIGIDRDLALSVYDQHSEPIWNTSTTVKPTIGIAKGDGGLSLALADAGEQQVKSFTDKTHKGHRILLGSFPDTDAELELILALSDGGELLVQIDQTGGNDVVQRVDGLYDWKLGPGKGTYTFVPRGGGYLIRSDSGTAASLEGFIGSAWSMPMYGMVRGDQTCYQIVETWWDANVSVKHKPNEGTDLSVKWEPSHGKLSYARRVLVRFAEKVDHVGMAKGYRQYLIDRGEFTTLTERIKTLPALKEYLAGVEYRWPVWKPVEEEPQVVENIRRFQAAGLPVSFFFPKWPGGQGSQKFLEPAPGPGGWPAANKLLDTVHELGCTAKLMVIPIYNKKDEPGYAPNYATGIGFPAVSAGYFMQALKLMLDRMEEKGFDLDALYFDCNSAYRGYSEHTSPAGGPITRRQTFEAQGDCFRETRRRGIVPGAELARFWSVTDADFFFFTDWSSDRLREGEPVPVFPLVFHDCFAAHFSGGGYYNEGKYDWYEDRQPRLYELMYAAKPSHNWLPGGSAPIKAEDWDTDKMAQRLKWLKRWHDYYQAICYSEMTDHQFLNDDHTLQRIEFANGVTAEFDLAKGLFRVKGVGGFTGDWEKPENVER